MDVHISSSNVHANGIDVAYLTCGSGPLALCLHGFPDSAHTWRHLLPELAEAGYRAVAPFMRGYAPTGVPDDGLFQTGALSTDANVLHEVLGGDDDAVLVGHDWGALAVYGAAGSAPDRWRRVVGMAIPPGGVMGAALLDDREQLRRSWYLFFFQHPLADLVVPAHDLEFVDQLWADWSPGYDAADDLRHAKACLREPVNLSAALGYYRASLGSGPRDTALDPVEAAGGGELPQPTLYLHGRDDGCVGVEVAETVRTRCPWAELEIVSGAGHFLQLERPAVVNELVVDFLTGA